MASQSRVRRQGSEPALATPVATTHRSPSPDLPRLHNLVRMGDVRAVEQHFDRVGHDDINLVDHKGRTALHLACLATSGNVTDMVLTLLRWGAYLHGVTARNNLTALHCACLKGNVEAARLLIKYGADMFAENSDGLTPFQLLPPTKEAKKFAQAMLKPPEVPKFSKRDKEFLALCVIGDEEKLLDLLDKGVDINVCDDKTLMTPLMCAARQGQDAVVRLLLVHCADVHRQDVGRNTALHWAAAKGSRSIVLQLLQYDASVNICDRDNGFTPLHWAVVKNHVDLIDLLVAARANPNLPDKDGMTPLHLCARREGTLALTDRLLDQRSIAVDAADAYGVRPLHLAVRRGDAATVELLVVKGRADVNVSSLTMNTPLHDACEGPYPTIVQIILQHGYDVEVNAKNVDGNTPLHVLVINYFKSPERINVQSVIACMNLLFQYSANPNFRNLEDKTPLMYINVHRALREGSPDNLIAQCLAAGGADLSAFHRDVFKKSISQPERESIHKLIEMLQRTQNQSVRLPEGWRVVNNDGRQLYIDPAGNMVANPPLHSLYAAAPVGMLPQPQYASISRATAPLQAVAGALALSDVACPLCSELLFRPCTTVCGHNFCQPCLQEAVRHGTPCPSCKAILKTADDYRINTTLAAIIERSFPERSAQRLRDYQAFFGLA